jgi:hypothetical protein
MWMEYYGPATEKTNISVVLVELDSKLAPDARGEESSLNPLSVLLSLRPTERSIAGALGMALYENPGNDTRTRRDRTDSETYAQIAGCYQKMNAQLSGCALLLFQSKEESKGLAGLAPQFHKFIQAVVKACQFCLEYILSLRQEGPRINNAWHAIDNFLHFRRRLASLINQATAVENKGLPSVLAVGDGKMALKCGHRFPEKTTLAEFWDTLKNKALTREVCELCQNCHNQLTRLEINRVLGVHNPEYMKIMLVLYVIEV